MKTISYLFVLSLIFLALFSNCASDSAQNETAVFEWGTFDKGIFDRAKEKEKLVLLDIGANWCHWCHVMDDSTYSDPEVQEFLAQNFVLAREDQDSRPDLFSAFRKWGWPAIIVFNDSGEELLHLKGFQDKNIFLKRLKNVVKNPIPADLEEDNSNPSLQSLKDLEYNLKMDLDTVLGGYNTKLKSLDLEGIQVGLQHPELGKWVTTTIKKSYNLVDTVWGGVYQYSAYKNWTNQHYEKIMRIQAEYIIAYSEYSFAAKDIQSLEYAELIYDYCERFLKSKNGLFFNSQNADVIAGQHSNEYYQLNEAERLKIGTPTVDKNTYLNENALMVQALYKLWLASEKDEYKIKADALLKEVLQKFKGDKELYYRRIGDGTIISFEDNRNLIEALLLSYQINHNIEHLDLAVGLADFCYNRFNSEKGILSVCGDLVIPAEVVEADNIAAVSTYHKLGYLTNNKSYNQFANKTLLKLDQEGLSKNPLRSAPLILANELDQNEAYHVLLITDNSNIAYDFNIMQTTLLFPGTLLFDKLILGEMNEEDEMFYGGSENGTIFLCTSSFCSSPINSLEELELFIKDL